MDRCLPHRPRLRLAAAVALTALAATACQKSLEVRDDVAEFHRSLHTMDLHVDSPMVARLLGYDFGVTHPGPHWFMPWRLHVDLPRMEAAGLDGGLFGLVVNPRSLDPAASIDRQIAYIRKEIVGKYPDRITLAESVADFERAEAEGRAAFWMALEGAHEFGGSLTHMARWHELGVRSVGLAHFTSNEFAASSADPGAERPGLSPAGRRLICEANLRGWVLDLAHTHPVSFYEALDLTRAPVIVSHTGVAAVQPTFRNLTRRQIRAVGDNGGVVGVIFAGFWLDMDAWPGPGIIADHMDVVREEIGVEHLAVGSDFDGFIWTPRGLRDVADMPVLTQTLLDRGYSKPDLRRLWGDNVMRVFREVERVAAELQAAGETCEDAGPLTAAQAD